MATTTISNYHTGLEVLRQFMAREDHSQVPKQHVERFEREDLALGQWVFDRRSSFEKKALSPEVESDLLRVDPSFFDAPPALKRPPGLYLGEAKSFARAGINPEEAERWIAAGFNAHQALEAVKKSTTLEEQTNAGSVGSAIRAGPQDDVDLEYVRKNLQVTTEEIRYLAGEKYSSAVTHWRKGKKNFPEPVVGGKSALFNLGEVYDWLDHHEKLAGKFVESWLWRKSVQALHQITHSDQRLKLRGYVAAMVFVLPDFLDDIDDFIEVHNDTGFDRWRAEKKDVEELVDFLRGHLSGMDTEDPTRIRVAATAFRHALTNGFTKCGLLDEALDALTELSDTGTTTSLPLSNLITSLARDLPTRPRSLLDIACGEATVLIDLLNRGQLPECRLTGVELDSDTAAITKIRVRLHDVEGACEILVGDSLHGGGPTVGTGFAAVVVDPPTKGSKAWITIARAHLRADSRFSRAFVLLPRSALNNDAFKPFIERRRLEAVVHLPSRLKRQSRGLTLCIFTSDNNKAVCGEILVVDLSDMKPRDLGFGTVTPRGNYTGESFPVEDVCAAIAHWRDTGTIDQETLTGRQRAVTASEAAEHGVGQTVQPRAAHKPIIEYCKIDKLHPDPDRQTSRQTEHGLDDLTKSIAKDGFFQPILVDDDYRIEKGNGRWRAARDLGLTEVPVLRLPTEYFHFMFDFRESKIADGSDAPRKVSESADLKRQPTVVAAPERDHQNIHSPQLVALDPHSEGGFGRVVEGLRDIGYTFPVAIADLIDNSIEAGATAIDVQVHLGLDGTPGVSIADDGCGMDREGLLNAMRYGAADVDDPSRLGRFGLGLKAASTGFCRSLTLVSTPGGGVPEMFATWDLDVVAGKNSWVYEIDEMTPSQADAFDEARGMLAELSGERPDKGTLVIWDKVDRLLVTKHGGKYADPPRSLRAKTRDLCEHLAIVFQRYLDPDDDRARTVVIAVNGKRVKPWDPFCERWSQVVPELQDRLELENEDGEDLGEVLVRGFILPKRNEVDDPDYGEEAKISLRNQGVYVYRENRMIEGPTWLDLFKEPHLNQLRIDISYQAIHDEFFIVDVKKKHLKLEPGLKEAITDILIPLRTEADNRSRGKGQPPG